MAAGTVYVLVNSAMPGLVKVGKTVRAVSERVAELSGVTGVATPFIVAFEQRFFDCSTAEDFVHAELVRRGLRASNNREFFYATVNEVVRIILLAPGLSNDLGESPIGSSCEESISNSDSSRQSNLDPNSKPWQGILESAHAHYFGHGDTFQDFSATLELYLDAARLGSLSAYEHVGSLYLSGLLSGFDLRPDHKRAFEFFKLGAEKGNYFCFSRMADLYISRLQNNNAMKAWGRFFTLRSEGLRDEVETGHNYPYACCEYIKLCRALRYDGEFLNTIISENKTVRRTIIDNLATRCKWSKKDGSSSQERLRLLEALSWARGKLSSGLQLL